MSTQQVTRTSPPATMVVSKETARSLRSVPAQSPSPTSSSGASFYADLVLRRVEERGKHVDHGVSGRARDLAEAVGALDGRPRDIVHLHTTVVEQLTESTAPQRTAALVASAQLVLAEVLGHLAAHYRRRATSTI
jgi:hypothetical protein